MLRFYRSPFILLCFVSCTAIAQSQVSDQQIKSWLKTLSIKSDPRAAKLESVRKEIIQIDSLTRCETIQRLQTTAEDASKRTQIRTRLLLHLLVSSDIYCPGDQAADVLLLPALQAAYEIEDEALQYEIHIRLGQHYNALKQFGQASMHYHLLFDILKRHPREEFHLPSGVFYDMSFTLYHTHEYQACIETGLNALMALPNAQFQPDDTLNAYQQMQCWNTIGLAYQKIKQYEKALDAFNLAEQIATKLSSLMWQGFIRGNKGDVYFNLGRYDSAYVLLQFDYDQSIEYGQFDNAANSLQWIARMDLRNGHAKTALDKLHAAKQLLHQQPQPTYLANVEYALTQVYATMGRPDSVNYSLAHYLHLHDSLETEITRSRTDILQMRLNNLDQVQTIKILNRQKKQIALARNSTIIIVVLIGFIAYLLMSRLLQKMHLHQKETMKGKIKAESEAQQAKAQLDVFRQNLLEKNAEIEQWQTAQESKESTDEHQRRISELTNHLILKEEDWQQFKILFDSVYPGFFNSLRNKVPDITQSEQRMAALSKLKLTAREAANLLGVSTNTVYTTRRRLRQRLGLENDSDLDPFLGD